MSGHADRLKLGFSLYCDILRFLAAFTVLVDHASWHNLSGGFLWQMQDYGQVAVIVFFVLSGYIIAYVSRDHEASLLDFSAARMSRLYSVVIPAIVLTITLDAIGMARDPSVYSAAQETNPVWRGLSALFFLSQSWWTDLALFSDNSYWSLPYEFWYYVLFGAAFFLRGKPRIIAVTVAALVAGPKILMLFPIWLAGTAAYWASRKPFAQKHPRLVFLASVIMTVLGVVAKNTGVLPIYQSRHLPPSFSLADYIIGAGVALNLYAASGFEILPLKKFKLIIRGTAGMTFSLYLFHLPILFFVTAFLPPQFSVPLRGVILIAAAFIASAILSYFTESRKGALKTIFNSIFRGIRTYLRPKPLVSLAVANHATDEP